MKTHYLPFNSISDLLAKVKILKRVYANRHKDMKAELDKRNIPYEIINEYGLSICMDGLSDEQIEFITKYKNDAVKNLYDFMGIETKKVK